MESDAWAGEPGSRSGVPNLSRSGTR